MSGTKKNTEKNWIKKRNHRVLLILGSNRWKPGKLHKIHKKPCRRWKCLHLKKIILTSTFAYWTSIAVRLETVKTLFIALIEGWTFSAFTNWTTLLVFHITMRTDPEIQQQFSIPLLNVSQKCWFLISNFAIFFEKYTALKEMLR